MALSSQLVDIGFSAGLDTKTDPNLVKPPALLQLINAIFTEGGTLVKRNGYAPLGQSILGGGTLATGQALATFNRELLQLTSTGEVYSYSTGQNSWVDRGAATPLTIEDTPVIRNSYTQSNPDMDTSGSTGVTVVAWEDTRGGVRASAYDEASGSALLTDQSISSSGSAPRVVRVGSTICVLYAESSALKMKTLTTTSPTAFSAAVTLDSSMPASGARIDAKPYDGQSILAAWNFSGQTRVGIVLPSGSMGSPVNGYPSPVNVAVVSTAAVDLTYDSGNGFVWILGASSGSGLYGTILTTAFVQQLAPTQVDNASTIANVTATLSGSTLTAIYEKTGSTTYNSLVTTNTLTSAGVVGSSVVALRSVGLGSKAFANSGTNYVLVNFSSLLQPTTFLVNSSTWNVIGKGPPFLSGGLYSGQVPKVVMVKTGQWAAPAPTRIQLVNEVTNSAGATTTYTSYFLVGIDRLDFLFAGQDTFRNVQVGGNLHITGGVFQIYDGESIVEHGFHFYPEGFTAVASGSGGSMADGTYGITVVWYWQDAQGQLHRSAPGVPISVTITGGGGLGSIALTIPTLRLTSKTGTRTNAVAAVFRTPANGTLYQRVGNGAADAVLTPVYNDPTTDTVSYSLTVNDAQIAANEILYTTGGALGNIAPAAASLMAASHDRIFLAGIPGQGSTVYYSQAFQPGGPVQFSPFLYANVDPRGGDVTALAVLDGNVVIFKEDTIFVLTGEGPDSTGNNDGFTLPQLVTSDVGCTNPESIVAMPTGLMFQSSKGIYLLDRALSCSYRGAPVERYNSLTVTSANLIDGVNQVRFGTSDGPMLVYDYFFNQWAVFSNAGTNTPTFFSLDALNWTRTAGVLGTFAYLNSTGTVSLETVGSYLDNATAIAMLIQTAWITMMNLQGFVKLPWVTVLGRFFSSHTLQVQIAYDFQGYASEVRLFNSGLGTEVYGTGIYGSETPYGGVVNTVYQFRFRPDTMKCQSIQFTFTEQSPTSGEGFALSGMTLQAAIMPTPFKKLPAGQTIASS